MLHKVAHDLEVYNSKLGTGGVQGQGKGQRLMGIKAVNDYIGHAMYIVLYIA